jgi:hypothetical protein
MKNDFGRRYFLKGAAAAGIAGMAGIGPAALLQAANPAPARVKAIGRTAFDEYVRRFNACDYNGVLDFWARDFTVAFAGYTFHGPEEFIGFCKFFHE